MDLTLILIWHHIASRLLRAGSLVQLDIEVLDPGLILSLVLSKGQPVIFLLKGCSSPLLQLLCIPVHDSLVLLKAVVIASHALLQRLPLVCQVISCLAV